MAVKKIYVLTGRKATGKTTSANHIKAICESKGLKVDALSFAYPLKKMCIDFLGLRPDQCFGVDTNKNTPTEWNWQDLCPALQSKFGKSSGVATAREILQIVGTDVFRNNFSNSFWVKSAAMMVQKSEADVVTFDDARFENEVSAMKDIGAVIVRLLREKAPKGDMHPSETALDNYPTSNYNYIIGPNVEGAQAVQDEINRILVCENIL